MKKVLIFDSGKGGKTIQLEIEKACKDIEIEYLEDEKYYPYGKLSENKIHERVLELLLAETMRSEYDAIVIACNSASTTALQKLRSKIDIPVIGVVPAIKPAVKETRNGSIALLATSRTIGSNYTKRLVADYGIGVNVSLHAVDGLVELAELKYSKGCCDIDDIRSELRGVLSLKCDPDVIILGCTHFPILRKELSEIFKNKTIIDSGKAVSKQLLKVLGY